MQTLLTDRLLQQLGLLVRKIPASVLLSFVVLAGFFLRLINLDEPFWGDEILSLGIVLDTPNSGELLSYLTFVEGSHPPLFFFILKFLVAFVGTGELPLRLFSVFVGLVVIVLTYVLSREVFRSTGDAISRQIGLVAALLVAVLPTAIEYSQRIRPYMLVVALALTLLWLFARYRRTKNFWLLASYIGLAILGLYLHYATILLLVAIGLFWFVEEARRTPKQFSRFFLLWLATHAAIFVGFYPWLAAFFYKIVLGDIVLFGMGVRASWFVPRSVQFPIEIFDQQIWFSRGGFSQLAVFSVVLFKLALASAIGYVFLHHQKDSQGKLIGRDGALFLSFVGVLLIILFLFSPFSIPYTPNPAQHILVLSVIMMLLLAYLAVLLPVRWKALLLTLFVVSIFPFTARTLENDANSEQQFRLKATAEFINEDFKEGDLLVTLHALFRSDFNFYLREDIEVWPIYPTALFTEDLFRSRLRLGLAEHESHFRLWPLTREQTYAKLQRLIERNDAKRVWLVYTGPRSDVESYLREQGWFLEFGTPSYRLLPLDLYSKERPKGVVNAVNFGPNTTR